MSTSRIKNRWPRQGRSIPFTAVYERKSSLDDSTLRKSWIDQLLFKKIAQLLPPWGVHRTPGKRQIVCAESYLRAVLPYCETTFVRSNAAVENVPARQVLGGHYVGHTELNTDEQVDLLDRLDAITEEDGHPEQARYTQIGDFPIYKPYEGKNRVDLYRMAGRPIRALICRTEYPRPSELKLIRLFPFGGQVGLEYRGSKSFPILSRHQVVVKNKVRIVLLLPFAESIPILEEYGVSWGKPLVCLTSTIKARICRMLVWHSYYIK